MARERTEVDITGISYEQFILFIFNRPLPEGKIGEPDRHHWYYDLDVAYEPAEIAAHYIQLFTNPESLRTRFSQDHLEEGFWAIQGPNLECSVYFLIRIEELPLRTRQLCVRSMFELFQKLFFDWPLDTAPHMWWDSLCYDWHCGNRSRDRGGEDRALQDVLFETLARILALDSTNCQTAALHGLGHLHHPDTSKLVHEYLEKNPSIPPELREYALAAAEFHVL